MKVIIPIIIWLVITIVAPYFLVAFVLFDWLWLLSTTIYIRFWIVVLLASASLAWVIS